MCSATLTRSAIKPCLARNAIAFLMLPGISAGEAISAFLPISTSDLSFVCRVAFFMISMNRSPTSARMTMIY
jgi:hypothetical protein